MRLAVNAWRTSLGGRKTLPNKMPAKADTRSRMHRRSRIRDSFFFLKMHVAFIVWTPIRNIYMSNCHGAAFLNW